MKIPGASYLTGAIEMAANYQQSEKNQPTHENGESTSKLDDGVLLAHLGKKEQLKVRTSIDSV